MTLPGRRASPIFDRLTSLDHKIPKLKREKGEERATDFVESLDRGLRLLQKFGAGSGPMTLSDLARAAELPRATARRIGSIEPTVKTNLVPYSRAST